MLKRYEVKGKFQEWTDERFRTNFIDLAAALITDGTEIAEFKGITDLEEVGVIEFKRTKLLDQSFEKWRNKTLNLNLYEFLKNRNYISSKLKEAKA